MRKIFISIFVFIVIFVALILSLKIIQKSAAQKLVGSALQSARADQPSTNSGESAETCPTKYIQKLNSCYPTSVSTAGNMVGCLFETASLLRSCVKSTTLGIKEVCALSSEQMTAKFCSKDIQNKMCAEGVTDIIKQCGKI